MKKVETYGNEQKEVKTEKKDKAPTRRACHICHGMGHMERPNGEVIDCRNVSCKNGYVLIH